MTDTELLDKMQALTTGYGNGWVVRNSNYGRGLIIHETSKEGASKYIRIAIEEFLRENFGQLLIENALFPLNGFDKLEVPPTEKVKKDTAFILNQINKIDNVSVGYTVEEGLCIDIHMGDETMYFEIYNNGEMGYIIENYKEQIIIENEDVYSLKGAVAIINFKNK